MYVCLLHATSVTVIGAAAAASLNNTEMNDTTQLQKTVTIQKKVC